MRVGFHPPSTLCSIWLLLPRGNFAAGNNAGHTESLLSWLRSKGGLFHDNLEIRRAETSDPNSQMGVFATDTIDAKELIIDVPKSALFKPSAAEGSGSGSGKQYCKNVRGLASELRRGVESEYAPYMNYLLETHSPGQLPSAWSEAGKALLLEVLGEVLGENKHGHILPPLNPFDLITEKWYMDCDGSDDDTEKQAALMMVQHEWDGLMIPVFDIMNHRNGRSLNTESSSAKKGPGLQVRTSRDIKAGEEIYTTYSSCKDCGFRRSMYGTADYLRDYGFVENYPQRWIFPNQQVSFEVDSVYDENGVATDDFELTNWITTRISSQEGIESLEKEYGRLVAIGETTLSSCDAAVPDKEWNTIRDYHKSMVLALPFAINRATEIGTYDRYVDLNIYPGNIYKDADYSDNTCEMDFYPWTDEFIEYMDEKTLYQEISFFSDPEVKDMCLQLDTTVQICESYRPHYHEMAVHHTAFFLNEIKRVLFVGGGDSMLLHESLKYPSLELVVGLELDQIVTRQSFKYFGTQPHYHNKKVQWWYGDAAKSLLMLPKEYFGSFDMVIVDLSETVMSYKVTQGLDIMEALTLLVKPDGIFLKNEFYMEEMSKMFKYSAQIHWYDNPVICSQSMVMGSNKIDFMDPDLTDHNVDMLFLDRLAIANNPYKFYHDYRKNETSIQMCQGGHNGLDLEKDSKEQGHSPGILMIVEAEQTSADLLQTDLLRANVLKALEKEGLSVVSTIFSEPNVKTVTLLVILQEGYVVARTLSDLNYVAYDIHLWGSFEKHENIEKALVIAVGSASSSSFRIIAGGMRGMSTWEDDKKQIGPIFTQACDNEDNTRTNDSTVGQSAINAVLKEMVNIIDDEKMTVAVICGKDTKDCSSIDALEKIENVNNIVLLSCSNMEGTDEFMEGSNDRMLSCENHIINKLKGTVVDGKRISAIVLDLNADSVLARVVLRVFKSIHRQILMPDDVLVMSANIGGGETEKWRSNFVRLFWKDIYYYDPVSNAEILFNSSDAILEVAITSYSVNEFVRKLKDALQTIEIQTGIVSEVQEILGGMWHWDDHFKATRSFGKDDYDLSSSLEQWRAQKPWGHQSIFQLDISKFRKRVDLSTPKIRKALDTTLLKIFPSFMTNGKTVEVQEFTDVGNGCVLSAFWTGGSAIIIWDGSTHIDVNLFLEKESDEISNGFKNSIKAEIPSMSVVLDDEFPRGTGRVINFLEDIREKPHWV